MDILELTNGKPDGNGAAAKTDFMNLRRRQPREGLQDRLLGLKADRGGVPAENASVEPEQASATEEHASVQANPAAIDSLVRGLVDLLPQPDGVWPLDDRAKWLRLAAGIFDLGYRLGDGEDRQINVALVKQDAPGA